MSKQNNYIVIISEEYVRDCQVFYPDSDMDLDKIDQGEYDDKWGDEYGRGLYLGLYHWDKNEESLKDYVAARYGYDKRILEVIKI